MARFRQPTGGGPPPPLNPIQQLAQWFRLGQAGGAVPGTAQPARARLRTFAEISAAFTSLGLQGPPAGTERWFWSYVCVWENPQGERITEGIRQVIETPGGANYQIAAANQARQRTRYGEGAANYPAVSMPAGARLRCFLVDQVVIVSTSPEGVTSVR